MPSSHGVPSLRVEQDNGHRPGGFGQFNEFEAECPEGYLVNPGDEWGRLSLRDFFTIFLRAVGREVPHKKPWPVVMVLNGDF